jgi:K+ transporter
MIQNILLIILTIFLLFFLSNDEKLNHFYSKTYIKYIFIFLIIYFIYQNYNVTILIVAIIIILFFNIDFNQLLKNNKYLHYYEEFKNTIIEYFHSKKELFNNQNDINLNKIFDFTPYTKEKQLSENNKNKLNKLDDTNETNETNETDEILNKALKEPFKEEVIKLKDLYENIKLEIKKLV